MRTRKQKAPRPYQRWSIRSIVNLLARLTDQQVVNIVSKSRKPEYKVPRFISIYLIRKYVQWPTRIGRPPLKIVGKHFNMHHSSILSCLTTVQNMIDTQDEEYMALLKKCEEIISPEILVKAIFIGTEGFCNYQVNKSYQLIIKNDPNGVIIVDDFDRKAMQSQFKSLGMFLDCWDQVSIIKPEISNLEYSNSEKCTQESAT